MKRYSFGTCPFDVITAACREQCPEGYPMTLRNPEEWRALAAAWNQGIDSHLEALTERSHADASTGKVLVHPDELACLLRRLFESAEDWPEDDMPPGWSLRSDILSTLAIEEV